jgi:hypothetical protein
VFTSLAAGTCPRLRSLVSVDAQCVPENAMHSVDEHKDQNTDRRERAIGAALLVLGLLVAGGALVKIHKEEAYQARVAQAQSTAPAGQNSAKPAESEPGGTRPTTPAPEPAQPQAKPGETSGSAPLTSQDRPPETGKPLPQAPAEKMAPPLEKK